MLCACRSAIDIVRQTCWSAARSFVSLAFPHQLEALEPYDVGTSSAGDYFEPELRQRGYEGLFWPKQCSPAEQYGFPCDGCALFYRKLRFEPVDVPIGMGPTSAVPLGMHSGFAAAHTHVVQWRL